MSRLLVRRSDPHSVYSRILPFLGETEHYAVHRRAFINFTSDYFLVRVCLVFLGDAILACRCVKARNRNLLLLEFSSVTALLFLLPARFLLGSGSISLNINHNLNNAIDRLLLKLLLNKFFSVVYIEPSQRILDKYPFVVPIRLRPRAKIDSSRAIKKLYVFDGETLGAGAAGAAAS